MNATPNSTNATAMNESANLPNNYIPDGSAPLGNVTNPAKPPFDQGNDDILFLSVMTLLEMVLR